MRFKITEVYVCRLIAQQIASNNARREALRLDAMIAASRQGKVYLNVYKMLLRESSWFQNMDRAHWIVSLCDILFLFILIKNHSGEEKIFFSLLRHSRRKAARSEIKILFGIFETSLVEIEMVIFNSSLFRTKPLIKTLSLSFPPFYFLVIWWVNH